MRYLISPAHIRAEAPPQIFGFGIRTLPDTGDRTEDVIMADEPVRVLYFLWRSES